MDLYNEMASLITEATKLFAGDSILNEDRLADLKEISDLMILFAETFDGPGFDLMVDEKDMSFHMIIKIPDLVLQNAGDEFVRDLVSRVDKFIIRWESKEEILVEFVITDLWNSEEKCV